MKEYPYMFNVERSPDDSRDWLASTIYPAISLPLELDLRGQLQPIRDQQNQGSCAAMAGAAMKEYQELFDSGLSEYFSPQFIYNLRDSDREGMTMRNLMDILRRDGDCREVVFPYGSEGKPPQNAQDEARGYIIQSYAKVTSVEALKTALFLNGVCIIAVPVYNIGERMWFQRYGEELLGGHALAVAGYTTEGFIIRNSWGTSWGQGGYCIMPFDDFGFAYDVWTTIDERSYPPEPEPEKRGWLRRWWWTLPVVAAIIVSLIIFT